MAITDKAEVIIESLWSEKRNWAMLPEVAVRPPMWTYLTESLWLLQQNPRHHFATYSTSF